MAGELRRTPSFVSLVYHDVYSVDFVNRQGTAETVVLTKVVGRGTYGNVYGGRLQSSGKRVVVKILRPNLLQTPHERRFIEECQRHMMLDHPNIVRCHGIGRLAPPDGECFSVLDECESTLRSVLQTHQTIPLRNVVAALVQCLAALEYMHARGIAHNDIKPENVLINNATADNTHVCLADFGLSKCAADADFAAGCGTLAYSAPERFADHMSLQSDVWSLAVVFYELLSGGQLPFPVVSDQQYQQAIEERAPSPLPDHVQVPRLLENLLADMLAKDVAWRPSASSCRRRAEEIALLIRQSTALPRSLTTPSPNSAETSDSPHGSPSRNASTGHLPQQPFRLHSPAGELYDTVAPIGRRLVSAGADALPVPAALSRSPSVGHSLSFEEEVLRGYMQRSPVRSMSLNSSSTPHRQQHEHHHIQHHHHHHHSLFPHRPASPEHKGHRREHSLGSAGSNPAAHQRKELPLQFDSSYLQSLLRHCATDVAE